MPSVFAKLNLKDQSQIAVLHAPPSFEPELASLRGVAVARDLKSAGKAEFFLAFVTKQKEIDALGKAIAKSAKGDAVVWFAYPKKSSKKYTCEFSRDTGFQPLGALGFEPVRIVAIDEDWSAIRLRRAGFIKSLTRSYAFTEEGKARIAKK
jgi:hypothetical protein